MGSRKMKSFTWVVWCAVKRSLGQEHGADSNVQRIKRNVVHMDSLKSKSITWVVFASYNAQSWLRFKNMVQSSIEKLTRNMGCCRWLLLNSMYMCFSKNKKNKKIQCICISLNFFWVNAPLNSLT